MSSLPSVIYLLFLNGVRQLAIFRQWEGGMFFKKKEKKKKGGKMLKLVSEVRREFFWVLFALGKRRFSYGSCCIDQVRKLHQERGYIGELDGDKEIVTIRKRE